MYLLVLCKSHNNFRYFLGTRRLLPGTCFLLVICQQKQKSQKLARQKNVCIIKSFCIKKEFGKFTAELFLLLLNFLKIWNTFDNRGNSLDYHNNNTSYKGFLIIKNLKKLFSHLRIENAETHRNKVLDG